MLRFSEDEFAKLAERIKAGVQRKSAAPVQAEPVAKSVAKRNKYNAKAVVIEGRRFDSKSEGRRYLQLKAMEQAGEISDLKLQTEFEIFPAQEVCGKKIRACFYRCDFDYIDKDGQRVIEDVKSSATCTPEYKIKAKGMAFFHGIVIREILMD